jgi:parvulin-like peptidyl-prolyl isomerase
MQRFSWGIIIAAIATIVPMGRAQDDSGAIAYVNGRPIARDTLVETLIEARGLEILQQLIFLELAKQEARSLGLEVTNADIRAEIERTLNSMVPPDADNDPTQNAQNQRQALERVLADRRLSETEFEIGMERNAYLRAIVEREFSVNEATLREEFFRTYGGQAQVRHIQIAKRNRAALHEVQTRLKAGDDFAAVARELSQNAETAPRGGELAPFSFNASDEQVPAIVREAAFSLAEGETSNPLDVGYSYQIIKLERRIPPRNVRFEEVRDEVLQQMRERVVPELMEQKMVALFERAGIRVLDRDLRQDYRKMLQANERRRN